MKKVFKKTAKRSVKNIRAGKGEYTQRLSRGDKSAQTKRRAAQEANAAAGGRLPDYMFRRAKQGKTARKA